MSADEKFDNKTEKFESKSKEGLGKLTGDRHTFQRVLKNLSDRNK